MNEFFMYFNRKVCEFVMECCYCLNDLVVFEGVLRRDIEGNCINVYQIN